MRLTIFLTMLVLGSSFIYAMEPQKFTLAQGVVILPQELQKELKEFLFSTTDFDTAVRNLNFLGQIKGYSDTLVEQYITSLAYKFDTSKFDVAQKLEEKGGHLPLAVRRWVDRSESLEKQFFLRALGR